jgi:ATP-binding cassette, subfamily B, bacterial
LLGKLFDGGHELNIGDRQKVALTRAMLRDSLILVLDEPPARWMPREKRNYSNVS